MAVVLFDLGNVLISYNHQKTLAAIASLLQVSEETAQSVFARLDEALGLGQLGAEELCQAFLVEGRSANVTCGEFSRAFCAGIEPDEAALRYAVLLQQLPDIEVAVISNTNAVHVSWLDQHVAALAEFELVIMSNEVEYLKPDPEIFELALELLEVTPGDTIFVDDSAENVAAARLLGIRSFVHADWMTTRVAIEDWLRGKGISTARLSLFEF